MVNTHAKERKRGEPKSRVLCLEIVYSRSFKLLLRRRRVSKMASMDPGRNVEHGNLRDAMIRDISKESRENGDDCGIRRTSYRIRASLTKGNLIFRRK